MTELKPSHIISYSLSLPTVINLPFALILSGIGALSLGEMGDFFYHPWLWFSVTILTKLASQRL